MRCLVSRAGAEDEDPVRVSKTQATLARVPATAASVLRVTKTRMSVARFLSQSSVTPITGSDILRFTVSNPNPTLAARLATSYAAAYTHQRRILDTAALRQARSQAEKSVKELKASGDTSSTLYSSLVNKIQLLDTMAAVQTSNATLIRPADGASKVSPRPKKAALVAAGVGLFVGIALAFLLDGFDTRVRSTEEIGRQLGLPLLGRLPEPPRRFRSKNRLVTLLDPNGGYAEAFRVLRMNVDFVNMDAHARTIMLTSAFEREGKSTTAANLAVTLARMGQSVILVDLDVRRPLIHEFFDIPARDGLTRVALGYTSLEDALVRVQTAPLGGDESSPYSLANEERDGTLDVLACGPLPPNPGEFAASSTVAEVITSLSAMADVVLIDASPLLNIGDALALMSLVDGVVLVCRLRRLRTPALRELSRILDRCPAAKLGFVVTGAEHDQAYASGTYGSYQDSVEGTERVL